VPAELGLDAVAHLLCWELPELSGSWQAWIRGYSKLAADRFTRWSRWPRQEPLEEPESYWKVPRRVRGSDGLIRPWAGEVS
jgi:hypothetical protein